MTRNEVLIQACKQCLKELYSVAQPSVTWEAFEEENIKYMKKYKEWERARQEGNKLDLVKYCGPKPYEFYYLPSDVFRSICDSYVNAYKIDSHQNLLDIIEILKNYCNEPIVDKYIDRDGDQPGYRGYEHPDNLTKEIASLLRMYCGDSEADLGEVAQELQKKFFEFLDMAGDFYNWNFDLNSFNTTVYLGASPCSNKDTVIKNWKEYRGKDITIDDSIYKEDEED